MTRMKAREVGTAGDVVRLSGIFSLAVVMMSCTPDETVDPLEPSVASTEMSTEILNSRGWGGWWRNRTLRIVPDSLAIVAGDTLRVSARVSSVVGDAVTIGLDLIDKDSAAVTPIDPSEWSIDFDPTHLSISDDFLVAALAPTPPGSTTTVAVKHVATERAAEVDVVVLPDEVDQVTEPGELPDDEPGDSPDNEPAGLTLIGAFDGSVKESDGHAFGISSFGSWFSSNPANVAVVTDPSNPTSSGRSLRFTWRGSDYRGAGIATARTFAGGPYRELYIRLRVFMESGGWDFGHKFFYLGRHTDARPSHNKPVQFSTDRPTGRNPEKIRLVGNGVPNGAGNGIILDSGNSNYGGMSEWPLALGQWLNIEYHLVTESSPGASNGTARIWVNGQLVASDTGIAWNKPEHPTPGFNGMEWYGTANNILTLSRYRLGELYISGKP